MPARGERIAVLRDGAPESSFLAGYDPAENRLYAAFDAKIERGDVVAFRDLVRRVIEPPKRWRNPNTGRAHGCVLQLEDAPPFLPDLGHLYRLTSGGFDQVTKVYLEPGRTLIWSGPCSVKPESTIGSDVEVARQKVTVQPFSVTVPLELVDVRPDDVFRVSSVRDPRLAGRDLVVTRAEGGSEELGRLVRVIDNQG